MRYLELIHRMLNSLAVLMMELSRHQINSKHESEATKAMNSKLLYDKMVVAQRWISTSDMTQNNDEFHMPVILQKYSDMGSMNIQSTTQTDGFL